VIGIADFSRHCEEPQATKQSRPGSGSPARDCFASLAMTMKPVMR
jgi:hypothetical protein